VNVRLISANVIVKVLNGKSLTVALDEAWSQVDDVKERAFIQAMCYGTIRYYFRLDFILTQLLTKPIKDKQIKVLALIGLFQLQYMRVKQHAAVSETVAVMKKKQWAKSLLNAILRRYLREQEELEALADKHVAYAHPDWMIKSFKADWGEAAKVLLLENNLLPPMVLRVNQQLCNRNDYMKLLELDNIAAKALDSSDQAILLEEAVVVTKLPKFAEGWVSVQDSAAQLAAELLDAQVGDRVLDVCAAPGGKAAHILERQPELASLLAVDIEPARLQRVDENLQRLGLNADLLQGDAADTQAWWDGCQFDRILLDAPCSALGVIRRHPDIKLLRRADDIAQLQELQQTILQASWALLKPGGTLLYATCSILKQENEHQIESFLANNLDATEKPIAAEWGLQRPFGRQILTGDHLMDGFYYACLQKCL